MGVVCRTHRFVRAGEIKPGAQNCASIADRSAAGNVWNDMIVIQVGYSSSLFA